MTRETVDRHRNDIAENASLLREAERHLRATRRLLWVLFAVCVATSTVLALFM